MIKVELENVKPMDIEKRSFEIITEELGDMQLVPGTELIVKRCIHTSADFDYAQKSVFFRRCSTESTGCNQKRCLYCNRYPDGKSRVSIKRHLARYGGEVYCFMSDEDVAADCKETWNHPSHCKYGQGSRS